MARAWLAIGMRVNEISPEALNGKVDGVDANGVPDVLIMALEALGAPEGNHFLLKVAA